MANHPGLVPLPLEGVPLAPAAAVRRTPSDQHGRQPGDGWLQLIPNLGTASLTILTTFRRDDRAVPTPVWYVRRGDRLVVATHRSTDKLKRVRTGVKDAQDAQDAHGARVRMAPGTYRGTAIGDARDGYAREVRLGEASAALAAVRGRYGLLGRLLFGLNNLRRKPLDTAIEIVPL